MALTGGESRAQSREETPLEQVIAGILIPSGDLDEVVAPLNETFGAFVRSRQTSGPALVHEGDPMFWIAAIDFPYTAPGFNHRIQCLRIGPDTHMLADGWASVENGRLVPPADGSGIEGTVLQTAWLIDNRAEWPAGASSRLACHATAVALSQAAAWVIRDAILDKFEINREREDGEWSAALAHGVVETVAENPRPASGVWRADMAVFVHQYYSGGLWLVQYRWVTYALENTFVSKRLE